MVVGWCVYRPTRNWQPTKSRTIHPLKFRHVGIADSLKNITPSDVSCVRAKAFQILFRGFIFFFFFKTLFILYYEILFQELLNFCVTLNSIELLWFCIKKMFLIIVSRKINLFIGSIFKNSEDRWRRRTRLFSVSTIMRYNVFKKSEFEGLIIVIYIYTDENRKRNQSSTVGV